MTTITAATTMIEPPFEWLRPGAETVEVDGVTYQLGVFDTGNGSLESEVGDGTIG